MSAIQQSDLKAVLQKHYGRFIASVEFVTLDSGEIVVRAFFADGNIEQLHKGNNNDQDSGILFHSPPNLARA